MRSPSRLIAALLLVSLAVALTVIGGANGVTASGGPERLRGADARCASALSKRIRPVATPRDPDPVGAVGPDAALVSVPVAGRPTTDVVVVTTTAAALAPRYLAALGRHRSRAPPLG